MPSKKVLESASTDAAMLRRLMVAGAPREHAQRAINDGITDEDIEWNARLGRPAHFLETVHEDEETKRRQDWLDSHDV